MERKKITTLGIGLLVGILTLVFFKAGLWGGFELFIEDFLISPKPVDSRIVILSIDDESLEKIGQWPWPREVFARALEKIEKIKPEVIGIDVVFAEQSRLGSTDDAKLAGAISRLTVPLVLPVEASPLIIEKNSYRAGNLVTTRKEFLVADTNIGHVNLILDSDGVARRLPLEIKAGDKTYRSFSGEIARISRAISSEEAGARRIVYAGPPGSVRQISFYRLFEDNLSETLRDKIVLIGATAADLHDEKSTPVSGNGEMSGVEIQANVINMMLKNYRLEPIYSPLMYGWLLLAALLPVLIFNFISKTQITLGLNIGLGFTYLIFAAVLFERGFVANIIHINLSWVLSTGGIFAYNYSVLGKAERELKRVFSKYVSPQVLNEILRDPAQVKLGGEEKEVTVFFSDIRGFTTLSEKIAPQELVRILNRYFTIMTEHILENRGVVDKFIGDAIMAFWGAPIGIPDQADRAIHSALAMRESLKKLNKELTEAGDPEINIGIGIFTGKAVVGNVGSQDRFDYTVMGDTVNVASRLEGLNKEYKTQIIIGEATKNKSHEPWPWKYLGSVQVKGRKEAIKIYTI